MSRVDEYDLMWTTWGYLCVDLIMARVVVVVDDLPLFFFFFLDKPYYSYTAGQGSGTLEDVIKIVSLILSGADSVSKTLLTHQQLKMYCSVLMET